MTQHRQQPRRRTRQPSQQTQATTVGSRPTPPARKPLRDMTPAELRDWLGEQQAGLEDFCSYAQAWTKRRERRGRQTYHDERYSQFFMRAADLIAGLDEMRQAAAEAAAQEEQ